MFRESGLQQSKRNLERIGERREGNGLGERGKAKGNRKRT